MTTASNIHPASSTAMSTPPTTPTTIRTFLGCLFLLLLLHSTQTVPVQDSSPCVGNLTDLYGVISSPGYPRTYGTGLNCLWRIAPNISDSHEEEAGSGNATTTASGSITLVFQSFQTQSSETLLVYNTDPNNSTSLPLQRYSDKLPLNDPRRKLDITDTDVAWIQFQSSNTTATGPDPLRFLIAYVSSRARCDPQALQHGSVENSTQGLGLDQTGKFQCDWGYRNEGASTGTCQLVWSQDNSILLSWSNLPQCVSTCPPPPSVPHATTNGSSGYTVNSTVDYACVVPYLQSGTRTLTCVVGTNGEPSWDQGAPSCYIPSCQTQGQQEDPISISGKDSWALVNPSYPSGFVVAGVHCHWTIVVQAGKVIGFNFTYFDLAEGSQLTVSDKMNSRVLLHVSLPGIPLPEDRTRWFSSGTSVDVQYNGPASNSTDTSGHRGFYLYYMAVDPSAVPTTLAPPSSSTAGPTGLMTTIQSSHSPISTKIPVLGGGDDDDKTPIASIVVGVVVPVVLILIALFIGYRCYRRRFPVRMTMGRNFGKFSNPAYSRPKSAATLVREAQGNGEDGGGVLNSQMQPSLVHGGPVSFLPGTTPGEGSRVMYVNEGYTPDSGDVDEESEADRRFRLAKAYLFKYEEDSDDAGNNNDKRNNKKKADGKQRGDKDKTRREDEVDSYSEMSEDFDDAGRTPPARKKGKRAANGAAMKGQDNPAFSGDNEEEAEKSSAGMSSSEDDLDKETDDPKAPAKPRRKRKQQKSPDDAAATEAEKRDSEYNSSMTVEDYMRTVATERERATGRSDGSAHESAGETDKETSSEQEEEELSTPGKSPFVRPPNEKVKGITVGEFMRLAKEKQRANSDVVRARADSLSQTYDVNRMSARRRAQSVDAMASPRRQADKTGVTRSESASYTSPPIASRSLRDSRDNLQTSLEDLSQIPHDEDSDNRMEVLEEKQDTEGLVEKTERTVVTFTNDSEHDSDKSSRSSSPMAAEHHPGDVDENGSDAEPAENDLYENAIVLANKQLIPRDMNQRKYAQGGSPSEEHDKDGKRTGDEKDKDDDDELYENTASSNKKDNEVDDDDDDELYENIAVSAPPVSVSITSSAATPERRRSSGSPNPAIHVSKTSSGESSGEDDVDSSIEPSLRGEASPPRRLKIVENTAPAPSRLLTPPPVDTDDRVKYIDFARSGSVGSAEGDSMQGSFVVLSPSSEVPNKEVDDDDLSIASVKSGSTSSASIVGLEEEHRGSAQNDPRDGDSLSGGEEAEPELRHAVTAGAPSSPNRSPQTDLRKIQAGSSKLLKGLTHSDASSESSVSLADDSGDERDDEKPRPEETKQPRRVQFVAGLKQEHTTDEEIDESDTDQEEEPEQKIAVSKSTTPALVTTAILTSPPLSSSSPSQPPGSGLAAVAAVPPTPQPSKTSSPSTTSQSLLGAAQPTPQSSKTISPPTTSQSLFEAAPPASQMTKVIPPTTSQGLFGRLRGLAGLRQHPAAVAGDTASSSRPAGASPAKTPEDVARSDSPPPLRGREALKQLGQQFREQGSGNKAPPTTAPTPDSTTSKDHVSSATSQASAAATPPASPAKRESRNDSDSDEIRFTDDDIDDALASDDDDDASSLEDLKPSVASPSQQKQSQGAGKVMLKVDTPTFTFGDPDDDDADDDDSDDDRGGHSGTYVFGKHADDDDDIDV